MSNPENSKKAKAYQLFAKGFKPSSPEVKALGLKGSTRASYYSLWQQAGSPGAPESEADEELIPKGDKIISEAQFTTTPPPQSQADSIPEEVILDEENMSEDDQSRGNQEASKGESEGEELRQHREPNGRKFPTLVAGQGLTFAVNLSIKTIALYQIAASMCSEELTLGDFIDTCVEDTYRGRKLDLGLVKIGGNHG